GDNFLWLGFSTRRGASRARPRSLSLPPCWRGSHMWGTRRLSAGINGRNLLSLSLMRRSGEASIRSRVPAPWDRGLLLERWWARSFVTPRGFTHLKVNLKNFITPQSCRRSFALGDSSRRSCNVHYPDALINMLFASVRNVPSAAVRQHAGELFTCPTPRRSPGSLRPGATIGADRAAKARRPA